MTRFSLFFFAFLLQVACTTAPPPAVAPAAPPPAVGDPHAQALTRDPDAMPEAVREALQHFRDRFACNNISGCPSEQVLLKFGWQVRPTLQQIFEKAPEQAPYRARTVRIVAELQDPQARSFLRARLQDTDPEVRAYAVFGLGLIDDEEIRGLLPSISRDDTSAWMAPVRLSAFWVALRLGDPGAQKAFVTQMARLAEQQMAVQGLVWGLTLCMRDDGPRCQSLLPAIARHPNFLVRRQVAKAMALAPLPSYALGLVGLTTETARSIADPAEQALRVLSGQSLHGSAQWRQWCEATQCARAAHLAVEQLYSALTSTAL